MRFIKHITLILTIFLLSAQDARVWADKGLGLTISFDNSEYKQSDQINIDFKLTNKGEAPVYINKRFQLNSEDSDKKDREIYLSIISPSGEKLSYKTPYSETGLPKSDYFVLLKPGEEAGLERKYNIKYYFDFTALGTYKITAVYQNVYGDEIGLDTVKDEIKSDTVEIKIAE